MAVTDTQRSPTGVLLSWPGALRCVTAIQPRNSVRQTGHNEA
jgi:hypothetical protein